MDTELLQRVGQIGAANSQLSIYIRTNRVMTDDEIARLAASGVQIGQSTERTTTVSTSTTTGHFTITTTPKNDFDPSFAAMAGPATLLCMTAIRKIPKKRSTSE